jgi:hypothetical protein
MKWQIRPSALGSHPGGGAASMNGRTSLPEHHYRKAKSRLGATTVPSSSAISPCKLCARGSPIEVAARKFREWNTTQYRDEKRLRIPGYVNLVLERCSQRLLNTRRNFVRRGSESGEMTIRYQVRGLVLGEMTSGLSNKEVQRNTSPESGDSAMFNSIILHAATPI